MSNILRQLHKYVSLTTVTFWLVQAICGSVLLVHRDLDDWLLNASNRPANLNVLDRAIASLAADNPGGRLSSIYISGGVQGQMDLVLDRPGAEAVAYRVDAADGRIIRSGTWDKDPQKMPFFRALLLFHKELLFGRIGALIIGLSGVILLVNILVGLQLAWPKRGRWRHTLFPKPARTSTANVYAWHRAGGLLLAPIAFLMIASAVLTVWSAGLQKAFAPDVPAPVGVRGLRPGEHVVPFSVAVTSAMAQFPQGTFAIGYLPSNETPWYRIRMRQPGELRRYFGTSEVYVNARDGSLLLESNANATSLARRFLMALYPVHSGEWGGLFGRILSLSVAVWLVSMIGLGITMWVLRRQAGKTRVPSIRAQSSNSPIL